MFTTSFVLLATLFGQAVPAAYPNAAELFARHEFSAAAAGLEQALRENPDYIPALLLKARLSIMDGQMDRARTALDRAISDDPHMPESRFLLGFLFYLQNSFDRADAALAAADQTDARVLLYRALSAEGLNHMNAAHAFYRQAIRADSASTDARIAFARLLRKEGENTQATKLVEEAFAISPESRDVLYEKGLSLLEQRRYQEAVRLGQLALAAAGPVPTEREIRFLLLRAWLKLGNAEEAARERARFEQLPMPLVR